MNTSRASEQADTLANYKNKERVLIRQLHRINKAGGSIAVAKRTTNLFRARTAPIGQKLDFTGLNKVIAIDTKNNVAEVEAATTYKDLVDVCLEHGLMPAVVPQFITITVGGAVSGGACEASSFKYGPVHDTVQEMTVLLATGEVITATPTNKHKDLFFALPNTFGSLGYILKLKILLVPVKPFVKMQHLHFTSQADYLKVAQDVLKTEQYAGVPVDFVDGMVNGPSDLHLTLGRFVDKAPYTSNYKYMKIYYKSITRRDEDYLPVKDFIWRWDTDWVWGSKAFGMQNKALRLLFGKFMLNSFAYWKLVGLDRRFKVVEKFKRFQKPSHKETMVQDVEIPVARSGAYLTYFMKHFDLRPIWVCPLKCYSRTPFTFSALDPKARYINFGFWGSVSSSPKNGPNHYNRLLETSLPAYNGSKALYSTNFYSPNDFWQIFDKPAYYRLKKTYDPQARLKDFYHKVCKEQV